MIEVWLLFLGVAGGSAGVGWLAGRRARAARAATNSGSVLSTADDVFAFGMRDVLVRSKDDELLVERMDVLCDGGVPSAAILSGLAGRGRSCLCVCFPAPREDVLWLHPVTIEVRRDPPVTLEHEGRTFERARSIPVTTADGEHGMFAEYRRGQTDRMIVLRTKEQLLVAVGESVPGHQIDRYPGPRAE